VSRGSRIISLLANAQDTAKDDEVRKNLAVFADRFSAKQEAQ